MRITETSLNAELAGTNMSSYWKKVKCQEERDTMNNATVTRDDLAAGTRIHYTGDMANSEGTFVVSSVKPCDFYGVTFDLREVGDCYGDEPRVIKSLHLSSFQTGPGRRFIPYEEYKADREARMSTWLERMPSDAEAEMIALLKGTADL